MTTHLALIGSPTQPTTRQIIPLTITHRPRAYDELTSERMAVEAALKARGVSPALMIAWTDRLRDWGWQQAH